jgi:regulator of sigma E protease
VARRNGVEAEEFGIGFPPRIWKKRIRSAKGDYDFTINALPLGGFVKLKGEHDADTAKGTLGAASLWVKSKIMLAGVVMNLVTAFVLLTILALLGMPKLVDDQFTVASDTKVSRQNVLIGYVEPGSPAEKAGLQVRDQLKSIGDSAVNTQDTIPSITKENQGKTVVIRYERENQPKEATVTIRSTQEIDASRNAGNDNLPTKGYLGISPVEYQLRRSTWSAPVVAAGVIKQFTELTMKGLGSALQGLGSIIVGTTTGNTEARRNGQAQASEQVSGPVGIFVILKESSNAGLLYVLMIIAVISLTLAIMNFLPIPALDGGRLFVTLVSRGVGRPLTARTEEWIHGTGFISLMILFVLITVVDVKRFF